MKSGKGYLPITPSMAGARNMMPFRDAEKQTGP